LKINQRIHPPTGQSDLLVFLRPPRLGEVKTRLAATLGEAEALRVYQFLLDRTLETASAVNARRWLYCADKSRYQAKDAAGRFEEAVQHGDDLGARMAGAFQDTFRRRPTRAVLIGTDVPELSVHIIEAAFHALQDRDMVIGPALDGGYYLLGLTQLHPQLFEHMPWSTGQVYAKTMQCAQSLGLQVHILPKLRDIDIEADWFDFLDRHPEIKRIFFPEKFV
jgi:rSAM/selenodomain-associated transferase 1